ncbi:MAG TPA: AMP-binding protein [Candidatus Limnocylindria bacterium]|nr:AMP-binding protein [Candidatus Limnocylindria bacterium]
MRRRNELILADLIAQRAEEAPDLDVVTFDGEGKRPHEVRTYADLWRHGGALAAALAARGMAVGDRFALLMRNHPEFVETMVAASIAGCVLVPIDPRTKGGKLAYTLNHSGARGLVCADYSLPQVQAVRGELPQLEWILVLESREEPESPRAADVPGAEPLGDVLAAPAKTFDVRIDDPNAPFEIIYTSGTTGDPKGVVCSNARYTTAAAIGTLVGFRPDDRPYNGLSLTHGNAQLITLSPSLHMKLRAVFSRKFTKSRLWQVLAEHGCTVFNLLGGMATAIYSEPPRPTDRMHKVRFVISAGMPAALWEPFERRFGVKILEVYGAVEGGIAINPIGVGPVGSFGKPPPGLDMKIVDEHGNECPPGVPGELVCRPSSGEAASVEYFRNPEASQEKTHGGWLRTGDICHRDADGWFYFDYRKGGGIRHNGDFINPGFVEKVIAEHPQVDDVFVYGVPAASGAPGEKDVVAAVVATDPATFDPASVFAACVRGLEPNSVPSYLQLVDEIPKTASEKPQERFLLERFAPNAPGVFARPG